MALIFLLIFLYSVNRVMTYSTREQVLPWAYAGIFSFCGLVLIVLW